MIVARNEARLYSYVRREFAGDDVEVVMDRRRGSVAGSARCRTSSNGRRIAGRIGLMTASKPRAGSLSTRFSPRGVSTPSERHQDGAHAVLAALGPP